MLEHLITFIVNSNYCFFFKYSIAKNTPTRIHWCFLSSNEQYAISLTLFDLI